MKLTYEREYDWQVGGGLTWKGKLEQSEINQIEQSLKRLEDGEIPYSQRIVELRYLKEVTFIEEVKGIAAEFRMNFKSGTSSKDQSKKEILRFLDSLENTSDTLQEILSEGKVDGRYRLSYAEEFLLFGTLSIDDDPRGIDPAFIKNLRGDLESVKDLVTRRRKIFEERKKEKDQDAIPDSYREVDPQISLLNW